MAAAVDISYFKILRVLPTLNKMEVDRNADWGTIVFKIVAGAAVIWLCVVFVILFIWLIGKWLGARLREK